MGKMMSKGPIPGDGMKGGKDDRQPEAPTESSGPVVQDTARLVELTVYGIATLYERFPARKKPEGEPAQGGPGAPATTK
jgi:hypothetical protein